MGHVQITAAQKWQAFNNNRKSLGNYETINLANEAVLLDKKTEHALTRHSPKMLKMNIFEKLNKNGINHCILASYTYSKAFGNESNTLNNYDIIVSMKNESLVKPIGGFKRYSGDDRHTHKPVLLYSLGEDEIKEFRQLYKAHYNMVTNNKDGKIYEQKHQPFIK